VKISKPLAIAGITSAVTLASLAGASSAFAQTSSQSGANGLVDKIAQKFSLNKDDVKAVFDEEHAQTKAEHQKAEEQRLDQAVTNGKITAAQKDKILAKRAELKAEMEANKDSLKDKTPAERKAAMDAKKAEIEKWATENDIPAQYLRPGIMGRHHGGPGMGMRDEMPDDQDITTN